MKVGKKILIGTAVQPDRLATTGKRTGAPCVVKGIGHQRGGVGLACCYQMAKQMKWLARSGNRNDLACIGKPCRFGPTPRNIALNRCGKPRASRCLWIELPLVIMTRHTVEQQGSWRLLWLANRHIKNVQICWRRYRFKKPAKLDKHIAVKNGMRWIKFHGCFHHIK